MQGIKLISMGEWSLNGLLISSHYFLVTVEQCFLFPLKRSENSMRFRQCLWWLALRVALCVNVTKATAGINTHSGHDGQRSVTARLTKQTCQGTNMETQQAFRQRPPPLG